MNHLFYKYALIFTVIMMVTIKVKSQTIMPDELTKNTIEEQINFIDRRTKLYENYRAIREDMFQKINKNIIDSISTAKNKIVELKNLSSTLSHINDSLNILLGTTRRSLEETTSTKNKIRVFGMDINKTAYNAIMWTIVVLLVVIFAIISLVFKSNITGKIRTSNELKELKDEFEAYRQSSRIAREKMAMDHFNEIKKLKGT